MPIATRRHLLAASALGAASLAMPRIASAQSPVRFALDWALQGNHGMWMLADDRGIFKDNGLSVKIDRGFGSGDTTVKVASGAYDLGFTDISTAVKFNADNPDKRVVSIYQVFDRTAAALITLKGRGINGFKDVAGRKLGAPEGEGSRMLFPAFAKAAGIDTGKIQWTSMAANLRDTMLAQNQVDAVTGFLFTTYFNLVGVGIKEEDILAWPYAENGLDLYGSAIVARADWLEKNPQVAAAFVKSSILGLKALIADPDAGMAALKKRESLFDTALEKRRWGMTRDRSILTPAVKEHGFGYLDMSRAEALIKANAEAYGVATPPTAPSMFTDRFLPAAADRKV